MDTNVKRDSPIFFNGAMIRAVLDDHKFQTRRLVKMRHFGLPRIAWDKPVDGFVEGFLKNAPLPGLVKQCPYGQPGDLLWCRETWRPVVDEQLWDCIEYRADGARIKPEVPGDNTGFQFSVACDADDGRWRPSIHMPRWASRMRLEIGDIRMERLQNLSEEDAKAEGIVPAPGGSWSGAEGQAAPTAIAAYRLLWESIYGECSWDANPWVWVIGFRKSL